MKKIFRSFVVMVMCMCVLFVGNTAFLNTSAETPETGETDDVGVVSEGLAQEADYILYEDFMAGNIQTLNPVTVVYGYDLDVTAIKEMIRDIKATSVQTMSDVSAEKRYNHLNREKNENSVMCMYIHIEIDGFFADYYEELSFAAGVSQDTRLEMAQSLTTQESMQQIAYDFIYNQLQSEPAVVSAILKETASFTGMATQSDKEH